MNSRVVVIENGNNNNNNNKEEIDGNDSHDKNHHDGCVRGSPPIKVKVSHGSNQHDLTVPSHSTFGDLKRIIEHETGLDPKEQKLLFRGKEKEDQEYLHMAGVKDNAKMLLMEDKSSKESKVEQVKGNSESPRGYMKDKSGNETKVEQVKETSESSRGCDAVAGVRSEVDKLLAQVAALESAVSSGTKFADKDFIVLSELLMRELLKLDSIEAEGEGRVQRKNEVRRVQSLVDTVDTLKTRNSNPFGNSSNEVPVTTKWETFDSGMGSLSPPPPTQSSTQVTRDWEVFE